MATNLFNVISPGVLEWFFIDINLPDTAADIQRSVGFVKFSIQPLQTIAPGTVIENNAAIVFDNNLPVITNTVFNTILGEPLTISPNGPATFCSGDSVILTASSANSYLWSTGDTSQSITVTAAGDYSVIDASECLATSDTVTVTEDLANVLPGTYTVDITDANGCVFASNFTVPGVGCQCDLTVGTYCYSTVQNITGNIVWDVSTSHPNCGVTSYVTVNNTIYVHPNAILTIEPGVTVAFGPNGRIVVLRKGFICCNAGVLNLDNCLLTGVGDCMWPGVQVHGVAGQQLASAQGKVNMYNGAVIEHAVTGILAGCENLNFCDNSYGGGIVKVQGSRFKNNLHSISFQPYPIYPSTSMIQSSEFVCDGQLRDPGLDPSVDGRSTDFIDLWYMDGVDITGNTFHNTGSGAGANSTTVIVSEDAKNLLVDNNTVDQCAWGITIEHPSIGVTSHQITGNTISNYRPNFGWAIYDVNGDQDEIVSNTITVTPGQFNFGITMVNSTMFGVSYNNVTGNAIGLISSITGTPTYSKICQNDVNSAAFSMYASGANGALEITCNNFSNYNTAWSISGSLPTQGNSVIPAGNLFNVLTGATDICTNNYFNYFYNTSPAEAEPNENSGFVALFDCSGPDILSPTSPVAEVQSITCSTTCTVYSLSEILGNYDSAQTCEEKAKWGKELVEYYYYNGQEGDAIAFLQGFAGQINTPLACDSNKVTVCHVPPGNPGNAHSLCISTNALQAHLNHGDYIGACAQDCFDSIMAIQAIYMLVPQYIEDSLFADASNLLALLPLSDQEQQAFFTYYQILIGLFSQDLTYYDTDSLQTAEFIDIANTCTRTATRAQAVLRRLYGMTFPLFWDQCGTELSQMRIAGDTSEEDKQVQKGPTVEVEKEALNTAPELQVYPNPNKGTFNINLRGTAGNNTCSVFIYDRLGELVYKEEQVTDLSHFVDLSRNSRGVYFVKVSCGDDILFDKIILQ